MGIILGLLILAVVGFFICYLIDTKTRSDHFLLEVPAFIIALVACIVFVICGFQCIVSKAKADLEYQNTLQQYEVIEYQLKNNKSDIKLLTKDITEYNNKVREYRKWKNNFWLNWFYPADIDKLEYIELN